MKILIACLAILLFCESCNTKKEQSNELKSFFNKCDELNIVYSFNDAFVFKTTDTSTIHRFTELITGANDNNLPSSNPKPEIQLVYKSKGKTFFTAFVYDHYDKKGISSNYVGYDLHSKKCKHFLTYQAGMGISEIYSHKINPQGNPWTNADTSKFHYEDLKNNR